MHMTLPQAVAIATFARASSSPSNHLIVSQLRKQDGSGQAELEVDLRVGVAVLAYDHTCILPGDSTQRCFQYS